MLELVLVSLLENALGSRPAHRHRRGRPRRSADGCEIRVVDHGPGVAPADRERIFEEFVRLDGRPGSGARARASPARFTEAQQGALTYEPTPGGGATFVSRCPAPTSAPA